MSQIAYNEIPANTRSFRSPGEDSATALAELKTADYYPVRVRTRCEDAIAELLRKKGYDVLCPSYVEERQYSDRVRKVNAALFPGYLFVAMSAQEPLPVLSTQGVCYIVRSGTNVLPLPASDLHMIETLCTHVDGCSPCEYFREGQRVRIESGPLAGLEGYLDRLSSGNKVILSVETIFRSVCFDARNTRCTVVH